MDPVTQGVLGGLVAQTRSEPKNLAKACVIGALAGMAPDLDVLIRSSGDPLLALEYHRHFTHSLLFVPFGGLLCAIALQALLGKYWQLHFKQTLLWCLLGYATHGLLDACTSYGTQLLWPLSNYRFAWDIVSVVDPAFTLPLLALAVAASRLYQKRYVQWALIWGGAYLTLGAVQHERAIAMGEMLAAERGHKPVRLEVKPSFANIAVWKLVYETEDRFYVDALKPGLASSAIWPGDSTRKLDLERDLPWLDPDSQQARDIERFRWFSANYIALDKQDRLKVVDVRYSLLPQEIKPLWGIQLADGAGKQAFADFYTERNDKKSALDKLLQMIGE